MVVAKWKWVWMNLKNSKNQPKLYCPSHLSTGLVSIFNPIRCKYKLLRFKKKYIFGDLSSFYDFHSLINKIISLVTINVQNENPNTNLRFNIINSWPSSTYNSKMWNLEIICLFAATLQCASEAIASKRIFYKLLKSKFNIWKL